MAWPDNLFRWLGFGRYNSTLPTVPEGQVQELQIDNRGRLRVAVDAMAPTEPATRYVSSTEERAASAKMGAGVVREVTVISSSDSMRYLHLVDKASEVSGDDEPFFRSIVPAGAQVTVTFTGGHSFGLGLQVALSSSPVTWTDPEADEGLFYVEMD